MTATASRSCRMLLALGIFIWATQVAFIQPQRSGVRARVTQRRATEAIEWLEPLDPHMKDVEPSGEDGTLVLPVFPLGGPYMPYTKQKLNIFEPRFFGCMKKDDVWHAFLHH